MVAAPVNVRPARVAEKRSDAAASRSVTATGPISSNASVPSESSISFEKNCTSWLLPECSPAMALVPG
jgi:hypothetical protein